MVHHREVQTLPQISERKREDASAIITTKHHDQDVALGTWLLVTPSRSLLLMISPEATSLLFPSVELKEAGL